MSANNHNYIKIEQEPVVPKYAIIAIVVLLVSLTGLFAFANVDQPEVTHVVARGAETTITLDNVTIYIPKDAIVEDGVISISLVGSGLFFKTNDDEWFRPQVVNVEYRNADGKIFQHVTLSHAILICFTMTSEQWRDYTNRPDAYQVQYYAEELEPQVWVPLPLKNNSEQQQICGETDYLSIVAFAIRDGTMIPITGSDVPLTPTPIPTPSFLYGFFNFIFPGQTSDGSPTLISDINITTTLGNAQIPTLVPQKTPTSVPPTATEPPATQPSATEPPATEPPATEPPATEPPATEPPATEPPATEPPATEPPATEPPATEPPATEPPATGIPIG